MQSIAEKDTHLDFIDGLRGIAILLVMANHWYQYVLRAPQEVLTFSFTPALLNLGTWGVTLFFMVSAFTLFRSCEKRFQREHHPYRNFYIRRAFRILPLWWVAVLLYVGIYQLPWFSHLACCFTLLFGFTLSHSHPVMGSWSLFVEETFYLFFPLVLTQLTSVRRAAIFLVVCYTARIAWLALAPRSELLSRNVVFSLFPLAHWYAFAVGILIYRKLPAFRGPHFPLLLRAFGICCYSLYLFHGAFLLWARPYVHQVLPQMPLELRFLATFIPFSLVSLLISLFTYRFFERPLVDLGKKLIQKLEPESPRRSRLAA